jgi:phage I-like protein
MARLTSRTTFNRSELPLTKLSVQDRRTVFVEFMTSLGAATPGQLAPLQPPTEFRIFRAGKNNTRKGVFLFDAEAAKSVRANSAQWGVDHAIDYNHAMISSKGADPALEGRAAGWFKLAIRDGELWAVDVRWTPAAHSAIAQGEWRYISPTFLHDAKTGRVSELLNVAITNLPATRGLDPLVSLSVVIDPAPESANGVARMKLVLSALGLAEDASESDAAAKVTALAIEANKVVKLTAEVQSLSTKIAEHEASAAAERAAKLAAEIDAAVNGGRVPPSQRETLVQLGADKPELVRALLANAAPVVKMDRAETPAPKVHALAALTDDDKRVAVLLGISETDFAKARAENVTRVERA